MRMTSIGKLRSMSWGGQAYRDYLDHIGKVEELRHEEGTQEAISELKTLTRGQRIGGNSSDLLKLPGNLSEGITKSFFMGRKGIAGRFESREIKRALQDFANRVKDEKN